MPPSATNPKIEELRFRIKTDPRSRHFFPLAEELRKIGRPDEAEQVLRTGLGVHGTYCAGWVSLGRVLREQGKNAEAVEPLTKALQIDPGNVVAARLLADAYFDLGEKVEAIKKYKLVHALLPSDEELEATIEQLERDLHPPPVVPLSAPEDSPFVEAVTAPESQSAEPEAAASPPTPYQRTIETPFPGEDEAPAMAEAPPVEVATADVEPMHVAHEESPFEDTQPDGYTADAMTVERPSGMHVEPAPLAAEVPAPWDDEPPIQTMPFEMPSRVAEPEPADVFAPVEEESPFAEPADVAPEPAQPAPFQPMQREDVAPFEEPAPIEEEAEDITETITMADLYAQQGAVDDARAIYEHILQRDPSNAMVWEKLNALTSGAAQPAPATEMPEPFEPYEQEQEQKQEQEPPAPLAAVEDEAPAQNPVFQEEPGPDPKVEKLQNWLAKVARREASRV